MEREEEEERRRKSGGNKLEDEKEGSVQSLREKTSKCDCEKGMEYRGWEGWVCARFKGNKFVKQVIVVGEMLRVYGVST